VDFGNNANVVSLIVAWLVSSFSGTSLLMVFFLSEWPCPPLLKFETLGTSSSCEDSPDGLTGANVVLLVSAFAFFSAA
jgi:ABC-type amino acid transport system permease subunit